MKNLPVVEFYRGKSVFVTGGSGFIGKVLVEKLLYSCSDIDRIYLLMRPSRDGKPPQQRLEDDLLKSRVFHFRKTPLDLHKIVAVSGDLTQPGLGMSEEDKQMLAENVSVVFHSAATVRFHGPLKGFIEQNVLGTDQIMQLSRSMKKLQAVVYVSTAYANCNLIDVEEKVYPLGVDVRKLIDQVLEAKSEVAPKAGDPELMGRPNSYTFSKAIAECLVSEKYRDLPLVICRPSIVTHAYKDPVDGWCDSFNGVAGTLLLGGLGIARTMEMNCDFKSDIIPVDFVANSLIVVGYHTGMFPEKRKPVIHITSGMRNPITWGQILDFARLSAFKSPSVKLIRPIAQNPISARGPMGKVHHIFVKLFSHFLFAYIFDAILFLLRKKRIMVTITRKMHRAFDVLEHFTNRQWSFRNDNYYEIFKSLTSAEQNLYESNVESIDWIQYCDSLYMGSRRYLLNEDDSTIEQGQRRQKMLIVAYRIVDCVIYGLLLAFVAYLLWPATKNI